MEKYSEKLTTDMLNQNLKTIIRIAMLKEIQISRKDGNVIEENE